MKVRTSVTLPEELLKAVDRYAKQQKTTRSNLIEAAVKAFITRPAQDEEKLEPPAWHRTILEDRKRALKAGRVTRSDWEQAKKRIKKKVS